WTEHSVRLCSSRQGASLINVQDCQNCPGVSGFTMVFTLLYSKMSPAARPDTVTCFCRVSLYIGACMATGALKSCTESGPVMIVLPSGLTTWTFTMSKRSYALL